MGWEKGVASAYGRIGVNYGALFDHPKALEYYFKALALNEKLGLKKNIAANLNNIGNVYIQRSDYTLALDYYKRALKINEEMGNKNWMARNFGNMANIYWHQKNHKDALENYLKAIKMLEELGDQNFVAVNYGNIANVYFDQKNYEGALNAYFKALEIQRLLGDQVTKATNFGNISGAYLAIAEDSSNIFLNKLFRGNRQEVLMLSKAYLDSAIYLGKEYGLLKLMGDNYIRKSHLLSLMGDDKEALKNYQLASAFRDSVFTLEKAKQIAETALQFDFNKKEAALQAEREKKDIMQRNIRYSILIGLLGALAFSIIVYRQRNKVKSEKKEVEKQKGLVEKKNNDILESITYAKRIQYTLLAHHDLLRRNLKEHFVFFQPKDIVSGDFYWAVKKEERFYVALCDSTGHGVPGAFMSLLNTSFLNEAVNEKFISPPNEVFDYVRKRLIENMSQEGVQDGMDAVLICIDSKTRKVTYAAANNSPVLIRNGDLRNLPTDKMPVGQGMIHNSFTLFEMDYQPGDLLYLYTDGFADQFGGAKGKKFKYNQLNELLLANSKRSFNAQKTALKETLENWKGELEQVDDICVIGIRV